MQAHQHITGVPKFTTKGNILDSCPTCLRAKMSKSQTPKGTTLKATVPYQGLSIDFAFAGTKSKDSDRRVDFEGYSGETSWCAIVDHCTGMYHGVTSITKASPLDWLSNFLQINSPDCDNKYCYMDQGGELYGNPKVQKLFELHNYTIFPTGSDGSFQNGPIERAHRTISNGI